jgi:hypothetical protein
MSDSPLRFVPAVEERTVRRIVGALVGLAGLLLLLGLGALLPGVDRLVAALAVSPVALLVALATLLVVGALIWIAPAVERAVAQSLDGPAAAVGNAAASAKLLVGFLAVVVAHGGLADVVEPLFAAFGLGGVYHLAFMVVGLLVLGALARRLSRCWRPVTALLTAHVTDPDRQRVSPE